MAVTQASQTCVLSAVVDPSPAAQAHADTCRKVSRAWIVSVFAEVVRGQIYGFGVDSYLPGLLAALAAMQKSR